MHTTGNLNNLTGDSNLGRLYRYMLLYKLTPFEQTVFMAIGRYSLGYCRSTTNVPSGKGYNRNSKSWADSLGISKTSFLNAVKSLKSKGLLNIHSGSTFRADGGSYPDYYSVKFNPELQKKYSIFFKLTDVIDESPKSEFVCPPIEDYFLHGDHILSVADNLQKYEILSNQGRILHPTVEELTEFLKD